jgi:signal transduction histidine kinase
MVGMWILVKTVWNALARLLRHFGWGGLLPVVAAMGMALFGVLPWTVALVLLALIVAAWWPAVAADLLPVTMLLAGIWALMVAAVSGATVNWYRSVTFVAPQALIKKLRARGGQGITVKGGPGQTFVKGGPGQTFVQGGPGQVFTKGPQGQVFTKGPQGLVIQQNIQGAQQNFVAQAGSVHAAAGPVGVHATAGPGGGIITPAWIPGPRGPFFGPAGGQVKPVGTVVSHPGGLLPTGLLVPLALLLLALGLWLTPRAIARLRDRMPWLVPYLRRWAVENRWGVLLIPVTMFGLVVFGVRPWTVAAVLVAVIAAVRWPKVAADLVPVALVGFAAWGFAIASSWQSLAAGRNGHQVIYGAVQVSSPQMALLAGAEASVFLALAAWLVPRTIGAHARTLLHPGPDPELAGRVQQLTETRGHAIDAATSELRRIERDLHDGAQARLVALGMNLRAVERMLPTSPQAALALVAEARETSSRALSDLRNLVRGIYPPVLADRGLGHAVQALALDTPLPVRVDVDLPGRLTAPVESACYFAVAEVLANAVRHSGASHVDIRMQHTDGTLRIEVCDDGIGGADQAKGTGLQGVERRLGTFDGIMAVSSPTGGPTMVVMEVPCALSSPKIFSS